MPRQFDVYRLPDGALVAVLQNDLLEALRTRVVAPLLPAASLPEPIRGLTVPVEIAGARHLLMPQLMATLTVAELGERVGSIADRRDGIVRACDLLFTGI